MTITSLPQNLNTFVKHFTSTILETSFPNNSQIIKINKKKNTQVDFKQKQLAFSRNKKT